MRSFASRFRAGWAQAWGDRRFRAGLLCALSCTVGALFLLSRLLPFAEARPGVALADPVLAAFPPVDLTWLVFGAMYGGLLLGVVLLLPDPPRFVAALQAYGTLLFLRGVTLWLTPLEAPADIIPLTDPVIAALTGVSRTFTKDLFFSGHASLAFLLFLSARGRLARGIFLGATAAIAVGVILQHVHYTVDVVVAFPAALAAWRLAERPGAFAKTGSGRAI